MQQQVCFDMPYPPKYGAKYSLNKVYAGKHWTAREADAHWWHSYTQAAMRKQGIRKQPFTKPVEIIFYWNDRLDLSNEAYTAKMIEDALKGWVILDDNRKYVQAITHRVHGKNCISVEVREIG
jgi:hypothetical protein